MNWKKLATQAKVVVDKRGGTESLKQDAGEVKKALASDGTVGEKLKRAAAAIKTPGAGNEAAAAPAGSPEAAPPHAAPAESSEATQPDEPKG